MSQLAKDHIYFPPEVVHELERGSSGGPPVDPALAWVRQHRSACERTARWETVKTVLQRVPDLLDADNPHEQADPYVVALAIDLVTLFGVPTIITDDRRDKPTKTSLATAAGLHALPTIPMNAFLRSQQIP